MSRASEICNEVAASRWKIPSQVDKEKKLIDLFKKFALKHHPQLEERGGKFTMGTLGIYPSAQKKI